MKGKITEGDVIAALQRRYRAPAWAFLAHVPNGTGWARSRRTADGLAMSLWPSRGLELHGFEVKVSRSDWLRELKEPEKAEEIAAYCDRWWVVAADAEIVQDGELPPAWGLLVLQRGGRLVTVREAPTQAATPPDRLLLAAILRKATEGMVPASAVDELAEARAKELEAAASMGREFEIRHIRERLEERERAIREFEQAAGIKISRWDAGKIGAAVKVVLEGGHRGRRLQLERIAAECERIAASLRQTTAELDAEAAGEGGA